MFGQLHDIERRTSTTASSNTISSASICLISSSVGNIVPSPSDVSGEETVTAVKREDYEVPEGQDEFEFNFKN